MWKSGTYGEKKNSSPCTGVAEDPCLRVFRKITESLFFTQGTMYKRILVRLFMKIVEQNKHVCMPHWQPSQSPAALHCAGVKWTSILPYFFFSFTTCTLCVQLPLIANFLSNCHRCTAECCSIIHPQKDEQPAVTVFDRQWGPCWRSFRNNERRVKPNIVTAV